MTKSEFVKSAIGVIEYVNEQDKKIVCYEFAFNGGHKDGSLAKIIVIIEDNENREMEQIEG